MFRVGAITRSAPPDLTDPRRVHLRWLRVNTGRPDYAMSTDGDLT
ncbi:MAG: hypothetical protein V3T83_15645 [Acidobacteriota bacterium]